MKQEQIEKLAKALRNYYGDIGERSLTDIQEMINTYLQQYEPRAGEETVRVLRLIEYEGPREKVENILKLSVQGTINVNGAVRITATSLDQFPRVIEEARQVPAVKSQQIVNLESQVKFLEGENQKLKEELAQFQAASQKAQALMPSGMFVHRQGPASPEEQEEMIAMAPKEDHFLLRLWFETNAVCAGCWDEAGKRGERDKFVQKLLIDAKGEVKIQ